MRPIASGAGRLPGLDGLRGLAGIGVVLVHVWLYTGNNDPSQPVWLTSLIGELRLGLMAFFVLSAFLLVSPWLRAARGERPRPAARPFLARRAARILPGYWLAIVGAFVLLRDAGSGRAVTATELPAFLLMAQNHVAGLRDMLVPPAWSLCVEITFYALLPLLGALLVHLCTRRVGGRNANSRRFSGPRVVAMGIAAALGTAGVAWSAAAYVLDWPLTVTTSLPTYLPIFACGIAAAALAPRTALQRRTLLLAGALLVALNGVWHHDGTGALGHILKDLPAGAGFGLVVAALAAGPAGLLERAPVRWLGTVSYGTYLWHMPIIFVLREGGLLPAAAGPAFAVVLVPTLLLGAISWYGVERPVLEWVTRRTATRGREKGQHVSVSRPTARRPAGTTAPRVAATTAPRVARDTIG